MKYLLLFVLLTTIFSQEYPPGKDIQLITKEKWVHDLIVLARDRVSAYSNKYPYNVLYYDGKKWTADCVNLNKALFNGRNIDDLTVNKCQRDLSNTGDITVEQMIARCTGQSNDFRQLKSGEPRILHLSGHIGAYLGQVVTYQGNQYNVVEATVSFGGGIVFSWVDSDGTRRNKKGGSPSKKWITHGRPTRWVKY